MRMRFLWKKVGVQAEGGVPGRQRFRPRKPEPGPPGLAPADGHIHLQHRGVVPLQGGQDAEQVGGPQVEEANHQGQKQQDSLPLGGHWALLGQGWAVVPGGAPRTGSGPLPGQRVGGGKGPQGGVWGGYRAGGDGRHTSPTPSPVFKPHRKGGGRRRREDGTQVSEKKSENQRQENKRTL